MQPSAAAWEEAALTGELHAGCSGLQQTHARGRIQHRCHLVPASQLLKRARGLPIAAGVGGPSSEDTLSKEKTSCSIISNETNRVGSVVSSALRKRGEDRPS